METQNNTAKSMATKKTSRPKKIAKKKDSIKKEVAKTVSKSTIKKSTQKTPIVKPQKIMLSKKNNLSMTAPIPPKTKLHYSLLENKFAPLFLILIVVFGQLFFWTRIFASDDDSHENASVYNLSKQINPSGAIQLTWQANNPNKKPFDIKILKTNGTTENRSQLPSNWFFWIENIPASQISKVKVCIHETFACSDVSITNTAGSLYTSTTSTITGTDTTTSTTSTTTSPTITTDPINTTTGTTSNTNTSDTDSSTTNTTNTTTDSTTPTNTTNTTTTTTTPTTDNTTTTTTTTDNSTTTTTTTDNSTTTTTTPTTSITSITITHQDTAEATILSWTTTPTTSSADKFKIIISETGGSSIVEKTLEAGVVKYYFTNAIPGKNYSAKVCLDSNSSVCSNDTFSKPLPYIILNIKINTPFDNKAVLSWETNLPTGTETVILKSSENDPQYTSEHTEKHIITSSTNNTNTWGNLEAGKKYFFRMCRKKDNECDSYSNIFIIETPTAIAATNTIPETTTTTPAPTVIETKKPEITNETPLNLEIKEDKLIFKWKTETSTADSFVIFYRQQTPEKGELIEKQIHITNNNKDKAYELPITNFKAGEKYNFDLCLSENDQICTKKLIDVFIPKKPENISIKNETQPKVEDQKKEEPKPKVEEPKKEEPRPKVEEPKKEEPKPKVEDQKKEGQKPKVEEPKKEEPKPKAEETKPIITLEPCATLGITNAFECEKEINKQHLPKECQEKNIADKKECEAFMIKLNAPKTCKGTNEFEECDKLIIKEQDKIDEIKIDEDKIDKRCRDNNINKQEECKDFLSKQNLPKPCLEKNIIEWKDCDDFMKKQQMPPECRDNNEIKNEKDCDLFMRKLSLPPECIINGEAVSDTECNKIIIIKHLPQECQVNKITTKESCDKYISQKTLPKECLDAGIDNGQDCEKKMKEKYLDPECRDAGINDEKACKDYMFDKYKPTQIACKGETNKECSNIVKDDHLGILIQQHKEREIIKEQTDKYINKKMVFSQEKIKTEEQVQATEEIKKILPFEVKEQNKERTVATFLPAQEKVLIEKGTTEESGIITDTIPVVISFDDDQDGLSNDMEKRLGTDLNNPDTDGDGYKDNFEIQNGYNPKGPGKLIAQLAPIDQAILDGKTLEQPKVSGEIAPEEELAINDITQETKDNKIITILRGKALPGQVVTIFTYSRIAIISTALANENGDWSQEIQTDLKDDQHEVYATIVDKEGKVETKSAPKPFTIVQGKIQTETIDLKTKETQPKIDTKTTQTTMPETDIKLIIAIIVAITIIILGVVIINKKNKDL